MKIVKQSLLLIFLLSCCFKSIGQDLAVLQKHVIATDHYKSATLKTYLLPKIENSQFILLGESHGIVEVGEITDWLYQISSPYDYNTLMVETGPLAARTITAFHDAGIGLNNAMDFEKRYPWSIAFYNNKEDYRLFKNVLSKNGKVVGIDYTLMAGYRMAFHSIIENSKNKALKQRLSIELDKANEAYAEVISTKNFMKAYIFSYEKALHEELMVLAKHQEDRAILDDLWSARQIADFQFSGQYYESNQARADLMKHNFMEYYNAAKKKDKLPKALLKLGYNHAGRGLTFTNVYDIGNLASELAASNGKRSLNILATGVSGIMNRANPVEPNKSQAEIKPSKYLPKAFYELAESYKEKYVILKTEELRSKANGFDVKTKNLLFKFDLIVLIKDAKPLTGF